MEQHTEKPADLHVLQTPLWITIIRGLQFLLALIILALAGRLIHDAYLDEEGLALAVSLMTWIIVAYIVLTEKIPSLRHAYHVVAVLALDAFLVILWLSAWAAMAARRAAFIYHVNVNGCFDDGSAINSKHCIYKRDIEKRDVLLFRAGLAMTAAIAGLGALVWLLFIATFVWTVISFLRGNKDGRYGFATKTSTNNYQLEAGAQTQQAPIMTQQTQPQQAQQPQQQQQQAQQYPVQPQHTGPYAPQQGHYQQPYGAYQQPGPDGNNVSPQGQYPPQDQHYAQYPQQVQSHSTEPTYTPQGSELAASNVDPYVAHPPQTVSPLHQ